MRCPHAQTVVEHVMWDLDRFFAFIPQSFTFLILYGTLNPDLVK